MPETDQQLCEVQLDGAWCTATLAEVRKLYTMAPKRCPACHGQIIVAGNYTAVGGSKLQHRRAHSGCPLTPVTYDGVPTRHPQAIN